MTGRDLISGSLRLLGAVASGESPAASEASDGLSSLNSLIDSLSAEGLLIYGVTAETPLVLTPGTASYTMGTGGSITTRPMEIVSAAIRVGTVDYPINRYLSSAEYTAKTDKSIQTSIPTELYDDGGYPLRTLTLYPVPSAANSLCLWTHRQITQISTLDTTISLPPGYERMLKYNLAIDIAPEYGRQVSQEIAKAASESKDSLKRANYRPAFLRADGAMLRRVKFNMLTGSND